MRYIDQMDIRGRRVLLRLDLNVPLETGKVADDARIRAALPAIRYALEEKSRLVIASHLDRPGGKVVPELSLAPVAERLSELLGKEVPFLHYGVGPTAREAVEQLAPGSAIMLENLRFYPGEEADSDEFAKELAGLADVYVDDAFADAHRAHASTVGVTRHMSECAGGLLMRREIDALSRVLDSPDRPLVAVVGGVKVSSKVKVLENLAKKVDTLLLGGAMASTFLKALGLELGDSVVEEGSVPKCLDILREAEQGGVKIVLPSDLVVADKDDPQSGRGVVPAEGVKPGKVAWDIGPRTVQAFLSELEGAGTILWNGPLGAFETEGFAEGTRAVGEGIARSTAYTLVGGGDTGLALKRFGLVDRISYVSTGGGAFLKMLAGDELPAVKALDIVERATAVTRA